MYVVAQTYYVKYFIFQPGKCSSLYYQILVDFNKSDKGRDPPWPSGYDAWLPSVSSQVRVSAESQSGLA